MVHPAARREESAGVPVEEFVDYDDIVASTSRSADLDETLRRHAAGLTHQGPSVDLGRDMRHADPVASSPMPMAQQYAGGQLVYRTGANGEFVEAYDSSVGPALPSRAAAVPAYQAQGRDVGAGYVNNPFDAKGRGRIGRQFWEAPLGGHLRSALAGQEVFGHTLTGGQARVAEQAAAGLLATGVGVPMFLQAVHGLTTPQTQGTIPMN